VQWLDELFDEGVHTPTNEPDILASYYLYIHAGRRDRDGRARAGPTGESVLDRGLGAPRNEDSGTMSSWYVGSAIGSTPTPGNPTTLYRQPDLHRRFHQPGRRAKLYGRSSRYLGFNHLHTTGQPRRREPGAHLAAPRRGLARGQAHARDGDSPWAWGRDDRPFWVSEEE
jgi:hypothetical protein